MRGRLNSILTLAALVGVLGIALVLRPQSPQSNGGSPSPAEQASSSATAVESPPASPTPTLETAVVPSTWSLEALAAPPGHPSFELLDASADGATVLFHDAGAFDPLYLLHDGTVSVVSAPSHVTGDPMFGRLSPGGGVPGFDDGGRLWQYDIDLGRVTGLPDLGGSAVAWYVFTSDSSIAALTNLTDTPIHPTQLWTVDLSTKAASKLGNRRDAVLVYSTNRGIVLQVDLSPAHDNTHIALYLVATDGSDSLLYDAGDVGWVAVSPDGEHLAFTGGPSQSNASWVVTLATMEKVPLPAGGSVMSFSPDGEHLAMRFSDGHASSYRLDGTLEATLPNQVEVTWVGGP